MNKKISPALIGAFVLGAVALIVIAILVFGSGRLFRQTRDFVLYFDNSVNGLRIGAPVKIKGVEIGSVKDIRLQLEKDKELKIPVIIEIDLEKFTSRGATRRRLRWTAKLSIKQLWIEDSEGNSRWRAWLQDCSLSPSIFFQAPRSISSSKQNGDYKYPEIPTLPTTLEQAKGAVTRIMNKLEEIDFKGLIDSLTKTSDGVGQLAGQFSRDEVDSPVVDKAMPQLRGAILTFGR